jgi:hypothetical protein
MVSICATEWFNGLSGLVGIVAVELPNGKIECFIGSVPTPINEVEDALHVVQFGSAYPLPAARYFFPWIELPKGF